MPNTRVTSKKCRQLLAVAVLLPGIIVQARAQTPQITITGADAGLEANIRASLRVRNEPCNTPLVRLERMLPLVRRQLVEASNALGYYHGSQRARFGVADDCWRLDVEMQPGPRVTLGKVKLQVVGEPAVQALFAPLLQDPLLQTGQPLHHGHYEALKSALSLLAADEGFLGSGFERASIALDLDANKADIDLAFDPGTRYRFGDITIRQDGPLANSLIEGLLQTRSGDSYSSDTLAAMRRRLDESQYFRQVRVTPELAVADSGTVPVTVELGLRPRHAWTGGLGFATDTGPRARLSYENRYVNAKGHRLQGDAALSAVRAQVDTNYMVPLRDPSRQSLNFGGGYSFEDNDSFESKRYKLETSVRNQTATGWLQTVFVAVQRDDYIVDVQQDVSLLSIVGASIGKTRADNLVNPSAGWKLFAQVQGATDALMSDTSFLQFYGSAKQIISLGNGRLLGRVEIGSTWIDAAADLPASLRYFAGGDQSLRGYDYRSLGPLNTNNEVAGGKQLVVGSVEYDHLVRDRWRVAVFADSGNAFNNRTDFKWQSSVGFGVRWLSPIGPVRVDLAHPLDGDESFRLHITMGPDL